MEEIGFTSVAEMLKLVPGVRVVKPPDSSLVMVFSTVEEGEEGQSDANGEEDGAETQVGGRRGRVTVMGRRIVPRPR